MPVVEILGGWATKCKNCKYHYEANNRFDASSKANLHMLTKRHALVIYHENDPESTAEIVQPSNTTQLTLGDDPPF